MSIQEIFPIEINYKLFFIDKFIKNKKLDIRYNSETRFFFLDSADYNNFGDLETIDYTNSKYGKE